MQQYGHQLTAMARWTWQQGMIMWKQHSKVD